MQLSGKKDKTVDVKTGIEVPSFEWVLDRNRPDSEGYCPVVLRQTYQGVVTDLKAGFSLLPTEWDDQDKCPKPDIPNSSIYQKYMYRMLDDSFNGFQRAFMTDSICYFPDLTLYLNREHMNPDGSFPIFLRYRHHGKYFYRATGISFHEKHWNEKLGQPKTDFGGFRSCKSFIEECYRQFVIDICEYRFDEPADFNQGLYAENGYPVHVGPFTRFLINGMKAKEQYGNAKVYTTAFHLLEDHLPSMDVPFSELNERVVSNMRKQLLRKGLTTVTIHGLFRTVRAIWNKAISLGVADRNDYPFTKEAFKGLSLQTNHRAIGKTDIARIIAYRNKYRIKPQMKLALDLFTFSYLCGGMPFSDMALLKEDNIQDGLIEYTRQKTHRNIRVAVPKLAAEIAEMYHSSKRKYVFPILDDKRYKTVLQQRGATRRCMIKVNKQLKALGEELGLPIPLTTYVARHSFATVLQQEGVSLDLISEMLGHQELETTKIYLAGMSKKQLLDIQNLLV